MKLTVVSEAFGPACERTFDLNQHLAGKLTLPLHSLCFQRKNKLIFSRIDFDRKTMFNNMVVSLPLTEPQDEVTHLELVPTEDSATLHFYLVVKTPANVIKHIRMAV